MRAISYEIPAISEKGFLGSVQRTALSLNISSGGILLLTDVPLQTDQVLKIAVPSVSNSVTPTLAEARWVRKVPFEQSKDLYFVGMKFLI